MNTNKIVDSLLGIAVGDALGVPFEFKSSPEMIENPALDMIGYGTHHQPIGTWSDDSSLTFCLAESLTNGYSLTDIASKFVAWRDHNYWTATGYLFDIGITTDSAISRLKNILHYDDFEELKKLKNQGGEFENGNGSLMRILPLLFHIKGLPIEKQFEIIWEVSALTHRHIRAAMSCLIYLKLAEYLFNGETKEDAYSKMRVDIKLFWDKINFEEGEKLHFDRTIQNHILLVQKQDLKAGGYVIEALEASLWCFLNEDNYKNSVLTVINLGHDTDTTGAITGGLAGLYYGSSDIPENWLVPLKRLNEIIELGYKLNEKYNS